MDVRVLRYRILDESIVALLVAATHLDCGYFKPECPFTDHACVDFIHEFWADLSSLGVHILSQHVVSLVQFYVYFRRDYHFQHLGLVPHC